MNVQIDTEPHCITRLRIDLPAETVSETAESVLKEFQQMAKIPGFRPGKIPRNIVQTRFKKQIDDEARRKLISDACRKAIKEKELRILSIEEVSDVTFAPDQPMHFSVKVITVPQFELPEYKGLVVKLRPEEVSDAELEAALNELRSQQAEFADVTGRSLEWDDFAVIDYSGTTEGKPIIEAFPEAGASLNGQEHFWIRLTKEAFLPGFCDQLIGTTPGETRQVTVVVPDDFVMKEMAGKSLEYTVRLKEIKARKLPELDDAFADQVVKGVSMEKLRELTREQLIRVKKSRNEQEKKDQVMKQLLPAVTCDLPQGIVRDEARSILSEIVRENMERGIADEVLKEHEEQLLGAAMQGAESRVKSQFVLFKIAETEKVEVTKEDLAKHLIGLAMKVRMPLPKLLKEIEKRDAMDRIRDEVLTAKTLDFLAANATVETIVGEPAEPAA